MFLELLRMPYNYNSPLISKVILFTILVACSSVLNFDSAFSQNPIQTQINDTSALVKVIEPIPLSNIGSATESTLSKIREIRSAIKLTEKEIEIDSLIPGQLKTIDQLEEELDLEEIEQMNLRKTENLKNDFKQMQSLLQDWRDTFVKKSELVNELKAELSEFKTQWNKTFTLERDEKLPQQVSERIQKNLNEIKKLEDELSNRSGELLTKQDEITGALIFIDEVLNAAMKTEQKLRQQVFTVDSPPIWQMFSVEIEDSIAMEQKVLQIIQRRKGNFNRFTNNYTTSIYYHLLFFVILFSWMLFLRNDVKKWSDEKKDDAIKNSLYVISKPFSSSLLVTLLVSGIFYGEATSDILDYYYALLVFPILTIVPGLITSIEKKYFYFVGGVFFVTQFKDYFSDLIILDRALRLLLDLLTIVLLVSLLKKRDKIFNANPNIQWDFAFTVMRICTLLLSIAVFANIFGNITLTKIFSAGSLTMIYGGTIIYASALILRSLFALLIQLEVISKLNMIQNYQEEVRRHIFSIIRWLAVIYWLYITFNGYLIFDPIYGWIEGMLTTEWQVGSVALSIGNILAFFVTLWIALTLSRFIRFILQDEILTHFELPRGVPGAISMIVRLVLITIGFILAFGAAKIDISNITIIFGALGVGIGFGLQNIFNNLVSGLILAFERPIQVGDIIQISTLNLMGEVKEIGIRASTVRTFDGAEVIVPNGNLISNEMINWTLSDHRRRQEILVGVAYGTDTNKVLEILNSVVLEQENVLKNPSPFIIFLGFGESSLDFRVLFWTHFESGLGTKSAVGIAIDEAFKKNGIEIPFPQRDLHVRSVSDTVDFQKQKKTAPTRKSSIKASTNVKKTDK